MATEIERRFLVKNDAWRAQSTRSTVLLQGYLSTGPTTVRVRMADNEAWLTIKGPTRGLSRAEFEYPIPAADAHQMLYSLCSGNLIEKTRHLVPHHGDIWEVDEFHGLNQGLVLAELEMDNEAHVFVRPAWLGNEVTTDPRYTNSSLALNPRPGSSDAVESGKMQ